MALRVLVSYVVGPMVTCEWARGAEDVWDVQGAQEGRLRVREVQGRGQVERDDDD